MIFGIAIAVLLSSFLGKTSLAEEQQMKIVYSAVSARTIIMLGTMIFICFHIRRLFDNKEIEMFLSKSISRQAILFSLFISFFLMSIVLVMPIVTIFATIIKADQVGLIYWTLSLFYELTIVIAFSLFFSLLMNSATISLLMSIGAYVISRLIGTFIVYINIERNIQQKSLFGFTEIILKSLSVLMPRLDLFTKSSWLVYGSIKVNSFGLLLAQALIYSALILFAASFDLRRKEF
jgi:ABC-type transport system involved in multi-copper enzyme maturation permease subunit